MLLYLKDRIRCGSQADLFSPGDGWIYKLFREARSQRLNCTSRLAFDAELDAFGLARADAVLRNHIPRFEGPTTVEAVVDARRRRRRAAYLLNCCYRTERLTGPECRVFGWPPAMEFEGCELVKRFEQVGVGYVVDASVFGALPGQTMKFIDIATFDARSA